MPATLEAQIKVSKMLALGFVFSIFWIGGIGSCVAFILGMRARQIIRQSNGALVGIRLAWWCIIVGGLGILMLPPLIFLLVRR